MAAHRFDPLGSGVADPVADYSAGEPWFGLVLGSLLLRERFWRPWTSPTKLSTSITRGPSRGSRPPPSVGKRDVEKRAALPNLPEREPAEERPQRRQGRQPEGPTIRGHATQTVDVMAQPAPTSIPVHQRHHLCGRGSDAPGIRYESHTDSFTASQPLDERRRLWAPGEN